VKYKITHIIIPIIRSRCTQKLET